MHVSLANCPDRPDVARKACVLTTDCYPSTYFLVPPIVRRYEAPLSLLQDGEEFTTHTYLHMWTSTSKWTGKGLCTQVALSSQGMGLWNLTSRYGSPTSGKRHESIIPDLYGMAMNLRSSRKHYFFSSLFSVITQRYTAHHTHKHIPTMPLILITRYKLCSMDVKWT